MESTFGPARSLWRSIALWTRRELPSRLLLDRLWRNVFARRSCGSRFARLHPSSIRCGARGRFCGAGGLLSVRATGCSLLGRFCAFRELEISIFVVINCILVLAFSPAIACPVQLFEKDDHSYLFRVFSSLQHSPSHCQRFVSHPPSSSCSVAAPPPPVPLHSSAHSVA